MNPESLLKGFVLQNNFPSSLIPFVTYIQEKIFRVFPEGDPCLIASSLTSENLLMRMRILREEIKLEPKVLEIFTPVWIDLGFDINEIFLDAIRLRCVPDKFHENEKAASVGFIHRDPWYANPQCQLNFWIPIFDVERGAGFRLYPSYFDKAISNNSEHFNYEEWLSLGGFQSNSVPEGKTQFFPSPLEIPSESSPIDIFGKVGQLIAFASHHLHGTSPNISGKARFTVEIRFVLLTHLENRLGPEKYDNHSTGSTLIHMYDLYNHEPVSKNLIKHYEDRFGSQ